MALRHTTSTLTTVVLGAVLAASTALAQEAPSPNDRPAGKGPSGKTKTGPRSAAEAANSQVYGMSTTRGARYLLRNGLDYLRYQQYDRALSFLREAETRITDQKSRKVQTELNDAEVSALKQGIEAAQRGLRRASTAETPYALSDHGRPANGFTPAKSSTRLAESSNAVNAPNQKPKADSPSPPGLAKTDDEDRGEPIVLASAESNANHQPSSTSSSTTSTPSEKPSALNNTASSGPTNLPEAPQAPIVSQLPDLTKADGLEQTAPPDERACAVADPSTCGSFHARDTKSHSQGRA